MGGPRLKLGQYHSPEYFAYCSAKQRCTNAKDPSYRNYGGRGIKFLFLNFDQFFSELGSRPSVKHTLDRWPNKNGNYEPGNVRWATRSENNMNRRTVSELQEQVDALQARFLPEGYVVIGKRFTFDAAHRLGRHNGKCSRPHGHTYILEIDFAGPVETREVSWQGMVVDYYDVKNMVEELIMSKFDHQDLNKVVTPYFPGRDPETENVTTVENLVGVFAKMIQDWMHDRLLFYGIRVHRVRLQETPNSWAEWRS